MSQRFIEARVTLERRHVPAAEALMLGQGALAITLTDCNDTPVWEPPVGETPLWEQVVLTGLFPLAINRDAVTAALGLLPLEGDAVVSEVEERVWERAWMDDFHPMQFGDNLWIIPTGSEPPDPSGTLIHLDPGVAFGTGTHATTRLCLEWMDKQQLTGLDVLDFGCGSGVLGIAAALKAADRVTCIDYDPQAVWATDQNAQRNGVDSRIFAREGDSPAGYEADVVIANILAGILIRLAKPLVEAIRPGGRLILTGILAEQAEAVSSAYAELGLIIMTVAQLDGWIRMEGKKP